ncbi:hypothetical protein RSAG8_13693, partial [Rhizoctonia solani AG-8 WAC10335]
MSRTSLVIMDSRSASKLHTVILTSYDGMARIVDLTQNSLLEPRSSQGTPQQGFYGRVGGREHEDAMG